MPAFLTDRKWLTVLLAVFMAVALSACGGGGGGTTQVPEPVPPPPPPTAEEMCTDAGNHWVDGACLTPAENTVRMTLASIAAAATVADAQAAYDAVKGQVTAAQGAELQAAVDARGEELATMAREAAQKQALMAAAGMIDTSNLMTQQDVNAANAAIAALKAALAAATDVSDADRAMYQGQVDAAETAVAAAQSTLNHAAQTAALTSAVMALQAIDLTDLSTQAAIDAANAAIAAVRAALAEATELSAAEKTMAMTEVATADRTVMMAQGRFDTAAQKMALADAAATLAALDLDNLMTQEQIDAAVAAITALDLALAAATNLTDAEKLDATVDVTVAKRKVERAETTLTENVGNQREALMTAGTALAAIDLADLDTQAKIDAADAAVMALKEALDGATHLSDSEKATYQTQLETATETVRTAQTGMDREGRMMAQRTAITSAVTMARTAVAGVSDDSTDTEVGAADAAIAALKAAIEGAVDLPEGDADVASAQGTLTTLEGQLAAAKTSRMAAIEERDKADRVAMAKTGKDLRAALAGPPVTAPEVTSALGNIAPLTNDATGTPGSLVTSGASAGLTIDAVAGAGTFDASDNPDAVRLNPGDSAGSLGGWAGTNYARSTGSGSSMVTNEARIYTNKGPGTTRPFSNTERGGKYLLITDAGPTRGYVLLGSTTDPATPVTRASAAAFTHSGIQTHQTPSQADAFYTTGTYDGASGTFRCAGDNCSSTNDGTGRVSALGGTWHFKPDASAMVMEADGHYLYYGWWVSKDDEGKPTAASAFVGRFGIPGDDGATDDDGLNAGWSGAYVTTAGSETLTGSATYAGHAAGKYAINNVLEATGHGGHFTADAEFQAKFSGSSGVGISGTIDNFRLNDGTEDPGWSVSLGRRGWGSDGAIGDAVNIGSTTVDESAPGAGTVWSIGDNSASRSGTWGGTLYDEKPGDPSSTGPGDGSNVPTTVTGTFYSEFSTIGRMVGAFGAEKQ